MQHLYTGFDGNILLPEVGRSKATWLTKGVLSVVRNQSINVLLNL